MCNKKKIKNNETKREIIIQEFIIYCQFTLFVSIHTRAINKEKRRLNTHTRPCSHINILENNYFSIMIRWNIS